jgi:hypothetical protein
MLSDFGLKTSWLNCGSEIKLSNIDCKHEFYTGNEYNGPAQPKEEN